MYASTVSKLSGKFSNYIYNFLAGKYGVVEPADDKPLLKRKARLHPGLEKLRRRKRKLKKAQKALIKAGLADSETMVHLKKEWRKLLRQHNSLRRAVNDKTNQRVKRAAELAFKKDPNKFAHKLFHGPGQSATPTFSKEQCEEYFCKTYRDEQRDHAYEPLPGMIRPGLPKEAFSMRPPSINELGRSARRKRNGASPALDAMPYVPFKKCTALIIFLHRLGIKMWKECDVADDWAQAFMALLKKGSLEEDLDVPEEFRPITMTACAGKIFLSVISDRLQRFFVKNDYIPRDLQKGFLAGVPGCVEHSFMLFEAMREAKDLHRQIVVSWIDLANAYGSVRHNLIQFALNWYHVPLPIQKMIFNYYNKCMAKVVTKEWTSGFFLFDIGLFQGCVLSTILFICVFQLLLDFLRPLQEKHGYGFKTVNIKTLAEAYADDLAIQTKDSKSNQIVCDTTNAWLDWTVTMKAKPKKCVSLGLKQFDNRIKSETFVPTYPGMTYSPFDPKLTIDNKPMNYILSDPNTFKGQHFKFLGRWINFNLSETEIKAKITSAFEQDVSTVDKARINGVMKLWLYQHYILPRNSWSLLIHDLDLSFAQGMQTYVQPLLKRWSGVGRTVDPGFLYRTRENFGLQLTSVADYYVSMQLIKAQLLQSSVDSNIRVLWEAKTKKEAKLTRHFRVSKLNTVVNAQVTLDLCYPTQSGRQGLGSGNFKANPTVGEKRKMASTTAKSFAEDTRVQHATGLAQQGTWMLWHDEVIPFDLSWQNLIYGPGPHVIKFVLNATANWVRTPDLLHKFGYRAKACCPLCGAELCTLHHIISNCKVSLAQKRYTWRHDSVLACLKPVLQLLLDDINKSSPEKPRLIQFVKAGEQVPASSKFVRNSKFLDKKFHDWKLLVDFDSSKILFPPEIYATPERPDIIIWSAKAKVVMLIELTCPAEEGIANAVERKKARYFDLCCNIRDRNPSWTVVLRTIEAGARGYVAKSLPRCLKELGLGPRKLNRVIKDVSTIVARCTYAIFLAHDVKEWYTKRALLTLDPASTADPDPSPARGLGVNIPRNLSGVAPQQN